jgi:hypothetical protein
VVWEDADGPNGWELLGRFLDDQGVLGETFFASPNQTASMIQEPGVTFLANGRVATVFVLFTGAPYALDSYGQLFLADGTPSGDSFMLRPEGAGGYESRPKIVPAGDGFTTIWGSGEVDGNNKGIAFRNWSTDASPLTTWKAVNTTTLAAQQNPSVAPLSNGNLVVMWDSQTAGPDKVIFSQRLSSDGAKDGAEEKVNTIISGQREKPDVAGYSDGSFVACWVGEGKSDSDKGLFVQKYDSFGDKAGKVIPVNRLAAVEVETCSIAVLADQGFVVTWTTKGLDANRDVWALQFDASGNPVEKQQ